MITLDSLGRQLAEIRGKVLSLPRIEDWPTLPIDAGLWEWRPQGGTVRLSAAWGRLLGIDQTDRTVRLGEYVGYVHPDDRPLLTLTMVNFLVGGGEYVSRQRMLHRDGRERRFLSRDVVVLSAHGHPSIVIGVDFDVTRASW